MRKISNGTITTVAGNGTVGYSGDGGSATSAMLNTPVGWPWIKPGNLYIADHGNNVIRKVSRGIITTIAGNGTQGFSGNGGPATAAQLNGPQGVAGRWLGRRLHRRHAEQRDPRSNSRRHRSDRRGQRHRRLLAAMAVSPRSRNSASPAGSGRGYRRATFTSPIRARASAKSLRKRHRSRR